MPRIDREIAIERPPADVWAVLGNLTDMSWVPGVASAQLDGMRRICTLEGGGEIHEELADVSEERRSYSYAQPVHPLGFKRSAGTIAVEAHGSGSRVVWAAELEFAEPAQEAQFLPMLEQGYGAALKQLKAKVESA
jgi:carbon monoxide dehydrogenase subunit G